MEPDHPRESRRRWVRLAALLSPAVVLVVVLAMATAASGGAPAPGDPAPAFRAPLLEGPGELGLSDLDGRPVVLNFWASWCGPCRDEAEILQSAYEEYGSRISFVGVDVRDAESDALAFQKEYGITYPSIRDEDQSIYALYGLTGQPETFFIDGGGVVVEHVAGPLSETTLFQLLDVLVARDG